MLFAGERVACSELGRRKTTALLLALTVCSVLVREANSSWKALSTIEACPPQKKPKIGNIYKEVCHLCCLDTPTEYVSTWTCKTCVYAGCYYVDLCETIMILGYLSVFNSYGIYTLCSSLPVYHLTQGCLNILGELNFDDENWVNTINAMQDVLWCMLTKNWRKCKRNITNPKKVGI